MSIALMLVLALSAMALMVSVSFLVFARLPRAALRLAESHGRYAGLGTSQPAESTPGRGVPTPAGSLQQAA